MGRFLRIEAPSFVAHAEIVEGRLGTGPDDVAPIIGYMRGWTGVQVRDYCNRKGWRYSVHEYPEGS